MSHLKSSCTRFAGGMAALVAVSLFSSCEDDTFDRFSPGGTGISFDVEVTGEWTSGSRCADEVDIREMTCDSDADSLYLVTETSSADTDTMSVSAASYSAGRAAPITNVSGFHDSFGVSAMCYTGTPGDDFPMNFAHNLKMRKSGDTWSREDGLKLQWTNSGSLKFFAYSPYESTFADGRLIHSSPTDKGAPVLTYIVPDDAKSQTDIMTAVTVCDGAQKGAVSLTFTHALTAVTVKTGEAMLGGTIKSVTLKNVYGKGSHRIGSTEWTAESPRDFSISFGEAGKNLPSVDKDNNNYYTDKDGEVVGGDITLMMIPQTLPDNARIEIEFTDELTGTERHMSASLAGSKWGLGKKVTYSLNSTGIVVKPVAELTGMPSDITLRAHGQLPSMSLSAYAQVTQTGAETKILSLPFKLQMSVDGGSTWTPTGWQPQPDPSDPTAVMKTDNFVLPMQPVYEEMLQKMSSGLETGAPSSYYDLSKGGETANCYIISTPGYYSLPLIYGNARTGGTKSYTYEGEIEKPNENEEKHLVLRSFVGHDDLPIAGPDIPGAVDAVLVWQDAPDLVTDVKLEGGMLRFHAPKNSFIQGNAVVAVRNAAKEILWSWHIWATNYKWDGSADLHTRSRSTMGTEYDFAPCNLGYCDPHGGNPARKITLRVEFELPDGKTKKSVVIPNNIVQDEIVASIAGDNTYYQWGRKDPMLPGVYNTEIIKWGEGTPLPTEYNMKNKAFFVDDAQYAFAPAQSGVSIGTSIQNPHKFYISERPATSSGEDAKYPEANYLRRHWHDGRNSPYKHHAVQNFWDSQMDTQGTGVLNSADNERDVTKTIYDPNPVGYKIPPPNAFTMFSTEQGAKDMSVANGKEDIYDRIENSGRRVGWTVHLEDNAQGGIIFFPATGLRDMGVHKSQIVTGYNDGATPESTISWPAHADLTFVATSGFQRSYTENTASSSSLLFYLDNRPTNYKIAVLMGTNNSYGFTVRPIRE